MEENSRRFQRPQAVLEVCSPSPAKCRDLLSGAKVPVDFSDSSSRGHLPCGRGARRGHPQGHRARPCPARRSSAHWPRRLQSPRQRAQAQPGGRDRAPRPTPATTTSSWSCPTAGCRRPNNASICFGGSLTQRPARAWVAGLECGVGVTERTAATCGSIPSAGLLRGDLAPPASPSRQDATLSAPA
jgi:hypothetical protein